MQQNSLTPPLPAIATPHCTSHATNAADVSGQCRHIEQQTPPWLPTQTPDQATANQNQATTEAPALAPMLRQPNLNKERGVKHKHKEIDSSKHKQNDTGESKHHHHKSNGDTTQGLTPTPHKPNQTKPRNDFRETKRLIKTETRTKQLRRKTSNTQATTESQAHITSKRRPATKTDNQPNARSTNQYAATTNRVAATNLKLSSTPSSNRSKLSKPATTFRRRQPERERSGSREPRPKAASRILSPRPHKITKLFGDTNT